MKKSKLKMDALAHIEKRKHRCWAVVNPGNALCHSIHRTKSEANSERRENALAYVVVRAFVIPDYEWDKTI